MRFRGEEFDNNILLLNDSYSFFSCKKNGKYILFFITYCF